MSPTRRQTLRLTLLTAGLLASGLATAAASIDPVLTERMRLAKTNQALEVIVSFKQSGRVTPQQIAALKTLGIKKGVYMNRLPIMGMLATPAQVRELARRSDVVSVYYNARLRYMNYEGRQMTGAARTSTSPADFGRVIPFSGRGVTVVINDSGIDATHPDLPMGTKVQDNVFAAQNILRSVVNSAAGDDIVPYTVVRGVPNTDLGSGHGTHCAGTVAGTGTASNGKMRGVAAGADLVGYGSGGVLLILDAVGGLDYALANQDSYRYPVRTVSNSWGSSGKFDPKNPVNIATYYLQKNGILSVFAAGNDGPGEDTHNPYAQAPWVVSVGASEKDGVLKNFSSRGNRGEEGKVIDPEGKEWSFKNEPTIVAPGVDIISTRAVTGALPALAAPDDATGLPLAQAPYYTYMSGTSMATPHVAGITALMFEANPRLTPMEVKEILKATATNMTGRLSFQQGAGHVNAYAAVSMAAKLNRNWGSTTKLKSANLRVGNLPGLEVNLFNKIQLSVPVATATEFTFPVTEIKLVQIRGKVDNYSAPNGQGNAIVEATLLDPTGKAYAADGTTLPGALALGLAGVDGNTSTVTVNAEPGKHLPTGTWTLRVTGLGGSPVFTPEELLLNVTGRQDGGRSDPRDFSSLQADAKSALQLELMEVESNGDFDPDKKVTRMMLARTLMIAGNIRQNLPAMASKMKPIGEVATTSPDYPMVASVTSRGGVLRDLEYRQAPVMQLRNDGTFGGSANITVAELAYSLVQALGDQSVTDSVVATGVPANVPNPKHFKRAITLGFINASADPFGVVTKNTLASALLKYREQYRKADDAPAATD